MDDGVVIMGILTGMDVGDLLGSLSSSATYVYRKMRDNDPIHFLRVLSNVASSVQIASFFK